MRRPGALVAAAVASAAVTGVLVGYTIADRDPDLARPGPTPAASSSSPGLPLRFAPESLKYRVLDRFGPSVACDPDSYPVGRGTEEQNAREWWSKLNKGSTLGRAIAARLGWRSPPSQAEQDPVAAYREHKKLLTVHLTPVEGGAAYQFQFHGAAPGSPARSDGGDAILYVGFISPDGRLEQVIERPASVHCPVCLAGDTLIDTPAGPTRVRSLRVGDGIWTTDAAGRRVAGRVRRVVARAVDPFANLLEIRLRDGRRLVVAPRHPLPGGAAIGTLRPGAALGGSVVEGIGLVSAPGGRTYDVLPDGQTGLYFANGVLLASTIAG